MQNNANVNKRIESWHNINWYNVYRHIRNLRRRIFKASENSDWKKVRSLQKLMLKSYSNVLFSVRKATEDNKGRKTPGVDKILCSTPEQRLKMSRELALNHSFEPLPARRVYIPKKNGKKKRPLGIPTIRDRCLQAMVKNALEPCWEAQFEGISYGFRPGRSTHDAIHKIYNISCPNKTMKWVLDADIKGCFDNINHEKLLDIIGNFPYRHLIKSWLKAGYVDNHTFHPQISGTPQGGIISPLLANIALHGMEELLGVKYNYKGELQSKRCIVRYADDFVVFCKSQEDAIICQRDINQWLSSRGLTLSTEKTKLVHITEGFDFLGFNIRQYRVKNTRTGYKLLIKPSKEFMKKCRNDLRNIFLKYIGKSVDALLGKINPVIRGKANYMKAVVSSAAFKKLDDYLYTRQVRYVRRRHPNKSTSWAINKYWGKFNFQRLDKWVFGNKKNGNYMLKFSWTKIQRHTLVSKKSSPDDPSLKEYWKKRNAKRNKSEAKELNRKREAIAHKQDYKCPVCGDSLFNKERIHLHHIIQRSKGGKDNINNLVMLHQQCHHKVHHQK